MSMQIRTFDQWKDYLGEECRDLVFICNECNGTGETIDDCGCCGHETEVECEDCGGSGEVDFDNYTPNKKDYKQAVRKDLIDLANFQKRDPYEVFVEHGVTIYNQVSFYHHRKNGKLIGRKAHDGGEVFEYLH